MKDPYEQIDEQESQALFNNTSGAQPEVDPYAKIDVVAQAASSPNPSNPFQPSSTNSPIVPSSPVQASPVSPTTSPAPAPAATPEDPYAQIDQAELAKQQASDPYAQIDQQELASQSSSDPYAQIDQQELAAQQAQTSAPTAPSSPTELSSLTVPNPTTGYQDNPDLALVSHPDINGPAVPTDSAAPTDMRSFGQKAFDLLKQDIQQPSNPEKNAASDALFNSMLESTPKAVGKGAVQLATEFATFGTTVDYLRNYGSMKFGEFLGANEDDLSVFKAGMALDMKLRQKALQAVTEMTPDELNNLTPKEAITADLVSILGGAVLGGAAGLSEGVAEGVAVGASRTLLQKTATKATGIARGGLGAFIGDFLATPGETKIEPFVLGNENTDPLIKSKVLLPTESAAIAMSLSTGAAAVVGSVTLGRKGYNTTRALFGTEDTARLGMDVLSNIATREGKGTAEAQQWAQQNLSRLENLGAEKVTPPPSVTEPSAEMVQAKLAILRGEGETLSLEMKAAAESDVPPAISPTSPAFDAEGNAIQNVPSMEKLDSGTIPNSEYIKDSVLGVSGKANANLISRFTPFRATEADVLEKEAAAAGQEFVPPKSIHDYTATAAAKNWFDRGPKLLDMVLYEGVPTALEGGGVGIRAGSKSLEQIFQLSEEAAKQSGRTMDDVFKFNLYRRVAEDYKMTEEGLREADQHWRLYGIQPATEAAQEARRAGIGLPIEEVRSYLNEVSKEPWTGVVQKEWGDFYNHLAEFSREFGTLDEGALNNFRNTYGYNFSPALRQGYLPEDMSFWGKLKDKIFAIPGSKFPQNASTSRGKGYVKAVGGDRPYADPMTSVMVHINRVVMAAHRNKVLNSIADLMERTDPKTWNRIFATTREEYELQKAGFSSAKAEMIYKGRIQQLKHEGLEDDIGLGGEGGSIDEGIPESMALTNEYYSGKALNYIPDGRAMTFYRDGKRVSLEIIDPDVKQSLYSFGYNERGLLLQLFSAVKNYKRAITTLNPGFALRQFFMDGQAAGLTSRTGMTPWKGSIQGAQRRASDPEFWAEYLRDSGNGITYAGFANAKTEKDIIKAMKSFSTDYKASWFERMNEWAENTNTKVENSPRLEEYARIREATGNRELATTGGARVTIDFRETGSHPWLRNYSQTAAFFNANLQAMAQMAHVIRHEPGRILEVGARTITSLALMEYALNAMWWEPYYQLSAKERHGNFIIPYGKDIQDHIKIPLDPVFSPFFAGLPRAFLDDIAQHTGAAQLGHELSLAIRKVGAIPAFLPNLIAAPFEVANNKDWRGLNIVPDNQRNLPPEEQFTERTSYEAKKLGRWAGMSPEQIDYILSYFGGEFKKSAEAFLSDPIIAAPTKTLGEYPVIGTFFGNQTRDATTRVYAISTNLESDLKKYDAYVQKTQSTNPDTLAAANKFKSENPVLMEFIPYLRETMQKMATVNKHMNEIKDNPTMDGDAKAKALHADYAQRDQYAQDFIKSILTNDKFRPLYADSFTDQGPYNLDGFLTRYLLGHAPISYAPEPKSLADSVNKLLTPKQDNKNMPMDTPPQVSPPAIEQSIPAPASRADTAFKRLSDFSSSPIERKPATTPLEDSELSSGRFPTAPTPTPATPAETPKPSTWDVLNAAPPASTPKDTLLHNIDYRFIDREEGGNHLLGYVPQSNGRVLGQSGVTVGRGIDLGQQNLDNLNIPEDLRGKLRPYEGLQKNDAVSALRRTPLVLTPKETEILNDAVSKDILNQLVPKFDSQSSVPFQQLDPAKQTVLASLAYQYGPDLDQRASSFFKAAVQGQWDRAARVLRNFGDDYPSRRKREAELLHQSLMNI
jgi:hypothetical protein